MAYTMWPYLRCNRSIASVCYLAVFSIRSLLHQQSFIALADGILCITHSDDETRALSECTLVPIDFVHSIWTNNSPSDTKAHKYTYIGNEPVLHSRILAHIIIESFLLHSPVTFNFIIDRPMLLLCPTQALFAISALCKIPFSHSTRNCFSSSTFTAFFFFCIYCCTRYFAQGCGTIFALVVFDINSIFGVEDTSSLQWPASQPAISCHIKGMLFHTLHAII